MDKKLISVVDIALGLAVTCQEKLAATVDKMVKKGELGKQQATDFLAAVQDKGADGREALGKQMQESAKKVLGEIGFASTDEIVKLRKEIKELKALVKSA